MESILQEYAYLSNVDLELILQCRFHEYHVYKESLLIALEILYANNYKGLVITSLESRKRNIKRYLELANLRMINLKDYRKVTITIKDVINVLKEIEDNYIYKLKKENKDIHGIREYFEDLINKLSNEMILKKEK